MGMKVLRIVGSAPRGQGPEGTPKTRVNTLIDLSHGVFVIVATPKLARVFTSLRRWLSVKKSGRK